MSYLSTDCSCNGGFITNVIQCTSHCDVKNGTLNNQLIMQKQRRAPSSMFTMNLGAFHVSGSSSNLPKAKYGMVFWNQSSDRNEPSRNTRNVPSRGNSTRSSLTRHRPGAASSGNAVGVDIKHNSYDRYLARRKARAMKNQTRLIEQPLKGNKTRAYNMLSSVKCDC